MITVTLSYTLATIRSIASLAKEKSNYIYFSLPQPVKAWVIALGIRKHPRPYRRSRGGKHLFHRITTLTNKITKMLHLKGLHHNINYGNLWIIECQQPNNGLRSGLSITFDCHCAVVNCRSVGNKINGIKHEIYNHNLDLCALTERHGLKKMKTTPSLTASVHLDTTPYPFHALIELEGALH